MNTDRIKELESFVLDFHTKLEEAEKRKKEHNMHEEKRSIKREKSLQTMAKSKKKNNLSVDIFKEPPAWIPNYFTGREFEQFQKLNHRYFPNDWEIERIHLSARSFEKNDNLKNKNWQYTSNLGKEFGSPKLSNLSKLGQNIVHKFLEDNKLKETLKIQREKDSDTYRRSKPEPFINPWKSANHQIEYFEKYPIDDIHQFSSKKQKKFLQKDPFKIPKKEGTYFQNNL